MEFLLARAHCVTLVNTAEPLLQTASNVLVEHTAVAEEVLNVLCVVPGKQVGLLPLLAFHAVLENTPLNRDRKYVSLAPHASLVIIQTQAALTSQTQHANHAPPPHLGSTGLEGAMV